MTLNEWKLAAALLGTSALMAPSVAMAETPAPSFTTTDQNGVDLTTGLPWVAMEEGGIGSGPGRVAMQRIYAEGAGFLDNWTGGLYSAWVGTQQKMFLQWAGISDTFSGSGTTWTSDKADGGTLTFSSGTGNWIYTSRDGTVIVFPETGGEKTLNCPGAVPKTCRAPTQITRPDGLKFTLTWDTADICVDRPGEPCWKEYIYHRLLGVSSSAGYSLGIAYTSNFPSAGMPSTDPWFQRSTITFDGIPSHPSPSPAISYTYGTNTVTVTDPAGRATVFTLDTSGRLTGIKRPGSASNNVTYAYGADGTVNSATKDGVATSYARSVSGSTATETLTNALSQQTVVTSDLNAGRPTSYQDALSRTTSYEYDANARLTKVTQPEGNYSQFTYDARGNVTTTTNVAKSGSGLANIVTTASYDTTCTNVVKCNKPNSTTDAKGNVTDYTYNTTHGGLLTATLPAPTTGAVRPQTRYSYTQVTSASGDLVYMLTGVSACQTSAPSCTGLADESKSTIGYNSNLLPTTVTRANGTGTVTATTTMTYDPRGNMLTQDGPLSGTADTTAFKYDSADQTVGAISPDPDGAGSLKNRAVRLTYRPDGQVSKQEAGTTVGQTDAAFAAFVPLQTVDITFDSNSRPVTSKLSASGTNYALTQTSYDALGRSDCVALRMNPAIYGSLPANACTLGTQGSFGPDRITQTVYDAAGQAIQNKVAVGTTDAATGSTLTYTNNGMPATLKDGENNLTTFEYDGFDRLSKTRFPNSTKGSGTSSTTDYEQLSYDPNSNVTSKRLRDGNSMGFTYDNLNRMTVKAPPNPEGSYSFTYDNLNRLTAASKPGSSVSFTYDALSRKLTETAAQGTTSFGYDSAGRRTSTSFPGGSSLSTTYTYLLTGELDTISQGATVLADYSYDDLGDRTGVAFVNGASQTFGYDPVSRLTSLTVDLSGTANDLSKTLTYNPASQIVTETRSNTAYAQVLANQTQTSVTNGLNQLSTVNGTAAAYDARGNMTTDPATAKTYGYSSENQLTSASGGVTLAYDPMMRLRQVSGAATTRFAYDDVSPIGEYDGSNVLQRRYVDDPTTGQPVIWFEGTGVASTDRRYLSQDERGSIVSVSDSAGASLGINTYDEYGIPAAGNIGTFQYAGMMWLSGPGLYAPTFRAYAQHLGRFNQPDPLGYAGDGPNLYAYVLNDPANQVDPRGLFQDPSVGAQPAVNCISDCTGPLITVTHVAADAFLGIIDWALHPDILRINERNRSGSRAPHNYSITRRLTKMNTQCSLSQVSQAVNRNIIPGNVQPHVSGAAYPVSAMGLFVGNVTFRQNASGTVFGNATRNDHALCCGSVVTTIRGNESQGFTATVVGTGFNGPEGPFTAGEMAAFNQALGPDIFSEQLQDANADLLSECGG